jgi:hypothetical protein
MALTSDPVRIAAQESIVRTIKLCATTTKRPTTLRIAIDRSIAELTRTGRVHPQLVRPSRTTTVA